MIIGGGSGGGGRSGRSGGGGLNTGDRMDLEGTISWKPYGDVGKTITFDQKTSEQIRQVEKSISAGKVKASDLRASKDTLLKARSELYMRKSSFSEEKYNQLYQAATRKIDSLDYLISRAASRRP